MHATKNAEVGQVGRLLSNTFSTSGGQQVIDHRDQQVDHNSR